jgi:ABC-2 type transport system permease protein
MVNLVVILPILYISVAVFSIGMKLGFYSVLIMIFLPTIYAFLTALFGLLVNLHLPKLDAVSDIQVVKQSASAIIGVFGGMFFVIAPAILYISFLRTTINFELYALLCGFALISVNILLFALIKKKGVKLFERL